MKLITKLTLATSGALILLTVINKSVDAAIINYAFQVDSSTSMGNGSFSFDDAAFSNPTTQSVPVTSLNFQFDGDSSVYTEVDDVDYPDFPLVFPTGFLTGEETYGLQYLFPEQAATSNYYEINGQDFAVLSEFDPRNQIGSGKVTYRKVPEPTSLSAIVLTCGLGWLIKRKGTSLKQMVK